VWLRVAFLFASAALHLWLSSQFYFEWAWKLPVIDGGPLGFLSWTIPTLVGSLAYDAIVSRHDQGNPIMKLTAWAGILMVAGYALSCLGGQMATLPFVPPASGEAVTMWTMSQRTGSVSYLTFAAGFSLAFYVSFVGLCDRGTVRIGLFRIFGQNALAAYMIHPIVAGAVKPYLPHDAPAWYVALAFGLYFTVCYLFNRYLEKHELFLRL
jgi:hypothetical protein